MSLREGKIERVYPLHHLLNCMTISAIISAVITSAIWYFFSIRCVIAVNQVY